MKISLNWLREFVEVADEPSQVKRDLTGLGLGVESVTSADDDQVLEVEVTTNRPDCLSHYGVARELAALYRKPLKHTEVNLRESEVLAATEISIEISDPDLCRRYCGRMVRSVKVEPSPGWLAKRLESVGVRPINNVADVTNYVLMELGHPLHAFDLARLRQQKIVVRRARAGEKLRTLDGVDRMLTAENLVIADAERPVALAGVMGGEDSEISSLTRSVLLEAAWFDPVSVRRTAKSLGMHTEASHRFERGADIEMPPLALDRAAAMIAELAGGEILQGVLDVYPGRKFRPDLTLRSSEIARILGAEIPAQEIERILRALGFDVAAEVSGEWHVKPPSWRVDVAREVDLIEEVARHIGYDHLPARVRPAPPRIERDALREKEATISSVLVALGYREIISSSMVDPAENARFTDTPPVILTNPLSQEASAMRSTSLPGMIRALRWNVDHGVEDVLLFEAGKTYTSLRNPATGLPGEQRVLTLGASGHRRPPSIRDQAKPLDIFDLKGDIEAVLDAFEIQESRFEPAATSYFEPGFAGKFVDRTEAFAVYGLLGRDVAQSYKLHAEAWLAEINLEHLLASPIRALRYHPYSKFPAVERDFSLLLSESVSYEQVAAAIQGLHVPEIRAYRPVDLFRGGTLPAGHYSLLVRVTLQSDAGTLTAQQIAAMEAQIIAVFEQLGIQLRTTDRGTGRVVECNQGMLEKQQDEH